MSYYNDDKNKIRRKKISSSNSVEKPLINNKVYEKKRTSNTIKREKTTFEDRGTKYARNERVNRKSRNRIKKEKRLKRIKSILVLMLSLMVFVSAIGTGVVLSIVKGSPTVNKELIDSKYISSNPVSIDDIPENLKNAMVAIEDERFYKHNGVDIRSLVRSVVHNIFSDTTQGGSTIDMQVSKNLLTNDEKTIKRKIKDMYNAIQMNKTMDKDEILEAYLNNIYLGKSTYGVGKGAYTYFGKNVADLTLAQCAMLVGITNNPAKYIEHREAKKRQETVLYKMHELGYITDNEYKLALREDVPFKSEIE